MVWISEYQRWLTEAESLQNAQMVVNHFTGSDWKKESLSALCGNMRHESSLNPDMYEYGYDWSADRGYGLVQWTPRSKYWDWAVANNLEPRSGDSQLARIDYEIANNIQWIPNGHDVRYGMGYKYDITFEQFRTNAYGYTLNELVEAFMWNYEGPNYQAGLDSLADRQAFAQRCFNELTWNGSGNGYQLAKFPMDMINISQGENGSYSHQGTLCIDFVGAYDKYPYFAPCDCECIAKGDVDKYLVWKSDNPVMCADGIVRNIVWVNIHEDPLTFNVGDRLTKGQKMGHTGIGGNVTGDHWHFNVIEGSAYNGFTNKPHSALAGTELHIYDVFAVNDVNIVNGLDYDWKTSDYIDGTNSTPTVNNNSNTIMMLLADTLNGWKW